jgi:flagellar basal-body rod protein FlgB
MNIGGDNIQLLNRLLDASSLRGRVIAGNIANQNTPGFKRKVVKFENELRAAMAKGERFAARVDPKVLTDEVTPGKPDGNNVNMELESNAQRENRLTYEMYATILQANFGMINAAISEGR